ncbi:Serpentine Receptor, class BC (Class B-like) [Caenorhabditis elegans]|uniref:Serpentine Receptor, class BC (Class B-like) n=1 Tax=Caenorhabditis elegans TaxID=6239 RepID=Q23340_CAEEL|nr:Serpentine Receptor, class BC (Class B-like) [Caenorhabditis elegans]CAA99961.1 Serpentine Receptor, class BC (Class B-like) [Caenorhabditis elegans]|eukprot:NP_001041204.1 Serpentine Receptor, class BC (class B-like) [Caenorhabditis elegans]
MSSEFNYRAFSVTSVGFIASIFIVVLNIRLLWKFQNSLMKNKPEYHLFKIRFIVDICYSLTVSIYYFSLIVSYISPFILFQYKSLFIATLLSSNVVSTRFFLGALISIERLIAVFLPVKFHNNRQKISIFTFFIMLVLWGMLEDVMYFWVCNISPFEKTCSILGCTWNDCFLQYWTGNKLIIGLFTCMSSLILFVKLLSLKKAMNLNNDLSKTNYLCIGDACLTLIFDFSPFLVTLIFKTQLLSADIYGPYNATAKSLACFIDAVIAAIVLKIPSKINSIKSVNPRSGITSDRHGSSRTQF